MIKKTLCKGLHTVPDLETALKKYCLFYMVFDLEENVAISWVVLPISQLGLS